MIHISWYTLIVYFVCNSLFSFNPLNLLSVALFCDIVNSFEAVIADASFKYYIFKVDLFSMIQNINVFFLLGKFYWPFACQLWHIGHFIS